jgi:cytoskeletal protein RodZ
MKKTIVIILVIIALCLGIIVIVELNKNKKIDEISKVIDGSISSSRQKGNVAMLKANINSLRVEAEMIYNRSANSYSSLCKDGLLDVSDTQIKSVVDKILSSLNYKNQVDIGIKCFSSKNQYVISTVINPPQVIERLNYCVDQTGYAGDGVADDKTLLCINK